MHKLKFILAVPVFFFTSYSYAQIEEVEDAAEAVEAAMEGITEYDDTGFNLDAVIRKDDDKRVRKYPARLWQITGNGLKKPSYLYGTMHVSKKLAFNLGDTFYKALNDVDVVALELAIDSWFTNIGKNSRSPYENNGYSSSSRYGRSARYKDALRFPKFELAPIIYEIGSSDYMSNFLLYRQGYGSADYSEKTYVDLYIHQVGKKLGKFCTGLEDFEESDRMVSRSNWKNRTMSNKRRKGGYGYSYGENPIEKAYREGDLDLIDSLDRKSETNPLYHKWMLDVRNRVMANSIHKIAPDKSIFAAVGCAHLPGDSGVIDMLRGMGYTLTPIRDNVGDYAFKQKLKLNGDNSSVNLKTYSSHSGELEIDLPGEPIIRAIESQEELFYADVSNGSYYIVKKIPYYGLVNKISKDEVIRQIDSALYENVPGDITAKEKVNISGYPSLLVSNKTKSGESQRHAFIAMDNYVWYTKVNASGDYAYSKDVNKVIKSLKIKDSKTEWTNYEPESGGYSINWPTKVKTLKYSFDTSTNFTGHTNLEFNTKDEFYFLNEVGSFGGDIEGDSFHFEQMVKNLAFHTQYGIEKSGFTRIDNRFGYAASLKADDKSKYLHLLLVPNGNKYFYIGVYTKSKSVPNKFLNTFQFSDYNYKYLPEDYTDKETGLTYKTTNKALLDYRQKYTEEERELIKKDVVYPEQYSGASYFFVDSLKDGKSVTDYISFPSGEGISIRFYQDNKMAPNAYTKVIREVKDRPGTLFENYKKYTDSIEAARKKEDEADKDPDDQPTYTIEDLDYKTLDTLYKQGEFFVAEVKSRMRGSNVVNYYKDIVGEHQMVQLSHNYDAYRGISKPIKSILNSFKLPADHSQRLDSNQLADLFFELMASEDSISQFRLSDYKYQLNKIPSTRNDLLFKEMKRYSLMTKQSSKSIYESMEEKLRDDEYPGLINYYLEKYLKAGDTSDLQAKYLAKLSEMKNKKALDTMIYWLLEETPLKPEGSYSSYVFKEILYPAFDTLALWKPYYSKILPLRRYDEYNSVVLSIGMRLIDSSIADESIFKPLLGDLILSFRDDLKRKMSAKSKSSSYYDEDDDEVKYEAKDYNYAEYGSKSNKLFTASSSTSSAYSNYADDAVEEVSSYSGRWGSYGRSSRNSRSTGLVGDAELLMKFYDENPSVRKRINRALKIQNLSDRKDFIEVLLKGGASVPDSLHKTYLDKMDYRFGYASLLKENGLNKFVPKNLFKESTFVKDFSYYTRWNSSDTVVFIGKKKAEIEDEKGNMHFYKHRSKKKNYKDEEPDWEYAYVWIGAKDTLKNLDAPRYFSFGNDIPKKITFNELMQNEVDKLKYWKHPNWEPLIPEDEDDDGLESAYDYYD